MDDIDDHESVSKSRPFIVVFQQLLHPRVLPVLERVQQELQELLVLD